MNTPPKQNTTNDAAKTIRENQKSAPHNKRSPDDHTLAPKPNPKRKVQNVVPFVTALGVSRKPPVQIPTKDTLNIPRVSAGNDDITIQQQQTELSVEGIEVQILR